MMIGECCSKFLSSENMLLYKEHTFCHSSRFSPLKSLRKIHILIFKAFCSRPDICSPRCTLVTLEKISGCRHKPRVFKVVTSVFLSGK